MKPCLLRASWLIFPSREEVVDPARDPEFIVVLERLIVQASEPIRVHHGNGLIEDRLGLASL